MAENPMYPYRQRQRVGRLLTQAVNDDHDKEENDEGNAFGDAFQDVELTAAAQAREQEICEVINAELRVELQEQEANRIRVGDAVGENGDPLFVRATRGEAPIRGTEAHDTWLRQAVDSLP